VQGKGNFDVFDELFADDFVDHTPPPKMTPGKPGARGLYGALREVFPEFHAVIHWQTADSEIVTTQDLETCHRRAAGGPRRDQVRYC
jgi:hypothetical protein